MKSLFSKAIQAVIFTFIFTLDATASEDLFSVKFSRVGNDPYLKKAAAFYTITNKTGKDINSIHFRVELKDAHDAELAWFGYSIQTPEYTWLKAGESREIYIPIYDKPEAIKYMNETPNLAKLEISNISDLVFKDEVKEKDKQK